MFVTFHAQQVNLEDVRRWFWANLRKKSGEMSRSRHSSGSNSNNHIVFSLDSLAVEGAASATGVTNQGRYTSGSPFDSDFHPLFFVAKALAEVAHEAVLAGQLCPVPEHPGRQFRLTEHGVRCLAADNPALPIDPSGMVEGIRKDYPDVPSLDLLARYLSEATTSFQHGLLLAAATMVGCAYELCLVDLATTVFKAWPPDSLSTVTGKHREAAKRHLQGDYAKAGILADAVKKALEEKRDRLRDEYQWVESCFSSTFFLVRELRNDAGHPSGRVVARDEVFIHLTSFPLCFRRVRTIIDLIESDVR